MDIQISGRKINVGEALTEHMEGRLESIADKYFSRSIDAASTMSKEGHLYRVDVTLHANQGIKMQSRGEADDPYAAFETAADKVEKQLRRYKRRLKNHHNDSTRQAVYEMASDSVLDAASAEAPETVSELNGANGHGHTDITDAPVIIAETKREIPNVSVSDAVMLMDLSEATTFVFRNSKNKALEVIYRRPDGNIGWISPQ